MWNLEGHWLTQIHLKWLLGVQGLPSRFTTIFTKGSANTPGIHCPLIQTLAINNANRKQTPDRQPHHHRSTLQKLRYCQWRQSQIHKIDPEVGASSMVLPAAIRKLPQWVWRIIVMRLPVDVKQTEATSPVSGLNVVCMQHSCCQVQC